jgi:ABC-type Fe3+/spermidine/putrescine transport system ATPase subunit
LSAVDAHVRVVKLSKSFGRLRAVDAVSFEVRRGELLTLLGPSGCGKSTTLRLIAGLERPDGGDIFVKERAVASAGGGIFTPPEKRGMGMVFQNYAVWPHMTVYQNVAFPLQARRIPAAEARRRVIAVLETVGLAGLADRPAPHLSGGQQQRVALARALVSDPEVLLLDEPFSNLDARLRDDMRFELRALQRRLGVTSVFVTHDQTEAMMLSDRVLVMHAGQVEQEGTPQEVYESPATQFVMDFLGQVSHLRATVTSADERELVVWVQDAGELRMPVPAGRPFHVHDGVVLAIRAADVEISRQGDGGWPGTVESVVYLGGRDEYVVRLGSAEIRSERAYERLAVGAQVGIRVPARAVRLWPVATG